MFDLYLIFLRQHLERMNDWLLRAESRISLDDVIEPTYKRVQQQVWEHQVHACVFTIEAVRENMHIAGNHVMPN